MRTLPLHLVVVPLIVMPLVLTGCAANDSAVGESATPTASATASESPEIVTPITSPLEELNGTTVTLAPGDFYDVVLPSGAAETWSATAETPGIVEWMPVEPAADGSSVSTLAAVGLGTTVVTITDGTTSISFNVTVAQ
jgi:hypothetical protein